LHEENEKKCNQAKPPGSKKEIRFLTPGGFGHGPGHYPLKTLIFIFLFLPVLCLLFQEHI
jgi:hypothetical protein